MFELHQGMDNSQGRLPRPPTPKSPPPAPPTLTPFPPAGFVSLAPASSPHLVPNPATTALQEHIDISAAKEVGRRLLHLGQHPILTPNVLYQYGHQQNYLVGPPLTMPAISSWNPMSDSSTAVPSNAEPERVGGSEDDENENGGKKPYQHATAHDCLIQAYRIGRDFHLRTQPPFPNADIAKATDANERRRITKRHNSRLKRSRAIEEARRTAKWQAIHRRAHKAAVEGRVRFLGILVLEFIRAVIHLFTYCLLGEILVVRSFHEIFGREVGN